MARAFFVYVRRHHLALLALFVAPGGTSVAATNAVLPRNSVGTKQLSNSAVTAAKIRNNAVTSAKIKNGQVKGAEVDESTLGPVPKADVAVDSTRLGGAPATDYVASLWAHVSAGAVTRGHGVTSASGSGGVYSVVFDRSIRNCAAFATISRDDSDYSTNSINGANGTIQAYQVVLPGVDKVIQVVTTLPDGKTRADYDFNVMVTC
jgi:hypothetical protein